MKFVRRIGSSCQSRKNRSQRRRQKRNSRRNKRYGGHMVDVPTTIYNNNREPEPDTPDTSISSNETFEEVAKRLIKENVEKHQVPAHQVVVSIFIKRERGAEYKYTTEATADYFNSRTSKEWKEASYDKLSSFEEKRLLRIQIVIDNRIQVSMHQFNIGST